MGPTREAVSLRHARRRTDAGGAVRRPRAADRLPLQIRPGPRGPLCHLLIDRGQLQCCAPAPGGPRHHLDLHLARTAQKLLAYRRRMGWSFNWASSSESDFNVDFDGSLAARRKGVAGTAPDLTTIEASRLHQRLTQPGQPPGMLELVANLAFERGVRLLVALVELPAGHPLRGDEAGARERLQVGGRGRLSDAELVGDEDHAHAVLHEVAVTLRWELRLGVLEPLEDLQPFRARERAERLGVERHDTR